MTAQILQFPRAAKRSPLAPVGPTACKIISIADWCAKPRQAIAATVYLIDYSPHQPGQLGA